MRNEKRNDFNYRKIHALYCKGYSNEQIYNECGNLTKQEVLDIIQKIFGTEQMRKERAAR